MNNSCRSILKPTSFFKQVNREALAMDLLLMEDLRDLLRLTLEPFILSQRKDILRTKPCLFILSCTMKMISVSFYSGLNIRYIEYAMSE